MSLSVSRTQPSTSKRALRPKLLPGMHFHHVGVPWTAGAEQSKVIRCEGLYGPSQPAPVLKETQLDQNFYRQRKTTQRTSRRYHHRCQARIRSLMRRHHFPVKARGAGGNAGAWYVCATSGIDIVSQPSSVVPAVTPESGKRLQSGGIGIVSLPASGLPATAPALGMRSQSGRIGIVFQPALAASTLTCATALLPCSETTASRKLVSLWSCSNDEARRSQ